MMSSTSVSPTDRLRAKEGETSASTDVALTSHVIALPASGRGSADQLNPARSCNIYSTFPIFSA